MAYRKMSTTVWTDGAFMQLPSPAPNARYLFFYLAMGPHTTAFPGLYYLGPATIAERLGWPIDETRRRLEELSRAEKDEIPFVVCDFEHCVIFMPGGMRENKPESPNVVRSWKKAYDEIPDCELKRYALHHVYQELKGLSEGFTEALKEAFAKDFAEGCSTKIYNLVGKASPNQEQEQEYNISSHSLRSLEDITAVVESPDDSDASGDDGNEPQLSESEKAVIDALSSSSTFSKSEKWAGQKSRQWIAATVEAYPDLDIGAEIRKATAWCVANPRRTPRRGVKRFLTSWLNRADERRRKCEPVNPVANGRDVNAIAAELASNYDKLIPAMTGRTIGELQISDDAKTVLRQVNPSEIEQIGRAPQDKAHMLFRQMAKGVFGG